MAAVASQGVLEAGAGPAEADGPGRGLLSRLIRAVGAFVLGGLTAMEVLALSAGFVAAMAFLWASNVVAPETLVTNPWLRAAWVCAVLAMIRPATWVPFIVLYGALRRLGLWLAPGMRDWLRNAMADLGALAVLFVVVELVFLGIPGTLRWTLSGLGFLTGTVGFSRLGEATGHWDAERIASVLVVFILVRPVLPPLQPNLTVSARPLLGFVLGPRGRFDRMLIIVVSAASAVVAGAAYLIGR